MTAVEELKSIIKEDGVMKHVDPRVNNAFKAIYNALGMLANRIDNRSATEEEMPHDSQRMVSAKAKEALFHLSQSEVTKKSDQDELTDFEKVLAECINKAQGNILPPEHMAASWSHELLEEARKQLQPEFDEEIEQAYKNQDEVVYNRGYDKGYNEAIEDACEWLYENLINYWSQACTDNCDFIEDFRNALEKGGEL